MPTPLNPQEIYLLEVFSSAEYFNEMRTAWHNMMACIERAYERHMNSLPADYRRRPIHLQADRSWGETVIPNFRDAMDDLDDGYAQIKAGDLTGLDGASVQTSMTGQSRDYPPFWMTEEEQAEFYHWAHEVRVRAAPISTTRQGNWSKDTLLSPTIAKNKMVPLPRYWPQYQLNRAVQVKTGEFVKQSGIYLPEVDESAPELLVAQKEWPAPEALIGRNASGRPLSEVPTTWTLVERISDTSDQLVQVAPIDPASNRCEGGQPCPKEGYWFTPAAIDSRQRFQVGETMPVYQGSDYGSTIWQYDPNQS